MDDRQSILAAQREKAEQLGIGAVRVSDKEKAALEELRRYFGLNPAL